MQQAILADHPISRAATKRTEGARHSNQAELEFRSLLDAAVDAIIVIDHRGRIEEFSIAAERIFGYAAEEVIGRNVDVLMPAPYHAEHDAYIERYHATKEARIIGIGREVRARRKDGTIFPCELAVGQVAGVDPPRFIGFIRDITLRKLADERLRRSESELRLAQELANLGNYVVHLDHSEPDYYSPQLCRILGLSVSDEDVPITELIGRILHPLDREKFDEALARLGSPEGECDVEYRVVFADGSTRHLHHIAQMSRDPHGGRKHVGTIHDVTDRRQTEDEARQLQERLTHFSRLSTMGEMAAGLAHEINQPLAAIATYAQACQRFLKSPQRDDDDIVDSLEQINAQALRAGEVIRRLRNFVKNREVKREPVECNRLLEDLRTLAETDARLHNVRLRIDAVPNLPTVYGDPIQLQQVVLNLVRNAIDAMADAPAEQREVVLSTRLEAPQGEIEIVVADHGAGLAPEAAEHLFNPFFTTKSSGTGLGLAISRSIVRAHGGRLWHTPNVGTGARFHFTLPVSPAPKGE